MNGKAVEDFSLAVFFYFNCRIKKIQSFHWGEMRRAGGGGVAGAGIAGMRQGDIIGFMSSAVREVWRRDTCLLI
jgi:hypothetical protein